VGLLDALGLKRPKSRAAAPSGDDAARQAEAKRVLDSARKRFAAFAKPCDASLAKAQADVEAQVVPGLKFTLDGELAQLRKRRRESEALEPVAAATAIQAIDSAAAEFVARAARLRRDAAEAQRAVDEWGVQPLAALGTLVASQPTALKALFQPRLSELKKRLATTQGLLAKGDFDSLTIAAAQLHYSCQDLTTAITSYATEYPPYESERANVVTMLERMKGSGMLDGDGQSSLTDLEAALGRADAVGPIRGYLAARTSLNGVVNKAKQVRDTNNAYRDYLPEREKAAERVSALKKHAQAGRLTAEIGQLEKLLRTADALSKRSDGGSLKALTALKPIADQCTKLRELADKLAAAEAKLPALKKKLAEGGVDKAKVEETSRYALKLLVEENCNEDQAVKMAKDASGYVAEGLQEQDAVMSSRVKQSLEASGLAPEHAKAIGKNIRAGGTASADDAKALAQTMKGVSQKAIETLNKADIKTECCRGAITDAMPDLAGVKPRGWPDTASWDDVPGVYNPSEKKLVVGTMDDGGKRKVPAPGEGPLPHGATDLFGHEAGHAFDAADGGGKSQNAKFLAARGEDIHTGTPGGMFGPTDSYFLTAAEGGANDSGAASETFAESFAMHFARHSRWPKLEAFWAANPWGI
jgi:hypothetical protein